MDVKKFCRGVKGLARVQNCLDDVDVFHTRFDIDIRSTHAGWLSVFYSQKEGKASGQ